MPAKPSFAGGSDEDENKPEPTPGFLNMAAFSVYLAGAMISISATAEC